MDLKKIIAIFFFPFYRILYISATTSSISTVLSTTRSKIVNHFFYRFADK
jgi:hypothetical protein